MHYFTTFCRRHWLIAALLALTGIPAQAQQARYELDPEHLVVGFLVDHIGYARSLGMFLEASGSYNFDESTGSLSDVLVTVNTASVFTGHEKRDEHLRRADFLNSAEYPQMRFEATSGRALGDRRYEIDGHLTLLGVTRPLTLMATWNKSAEYPFGGGLLRKKPYVMGVSARGSFRRSDFGMTYAVDNGWVGNEVELIIEFEAQRQD